MRAILGGELDRASLIQASGDFEEWNRQGEQWDEWDFASEGDHLSATRLALIAGDVERARRLADTEKRFEWRANEFDILQALAHAPQPPPVLADSALLDRFDGYFEKVRNPLAPPQDALPIDIVRLEFGILRIKYFTLPGGTIDWHAVIDVVSQ